MIPIYDHRTIVGYAKTEKQAARILRDTLQTVPKGWVIEVKRRNVSIIDLPDGFVYCVHP